MSYDEDEEVEDVLRMSADDEDMPEGMDDFGVDEDEDPDRDH